MRGKRVTRKSLTHNRKLRYMATSSLDTLNDTVSPGRNDNLSEYPINGIFFIVLDHKPSREDMLPSQKRILKLKPLKRMELKEVKLQ